MQMRDLTPQQIVAELDKYIVGQHDAKRAVAVALRNRYRRQRLPDDMRDEVTPKNILMIGPTGVGKTEIARRVAKLIDAPFIKVEATKFTEVGYVGRDVESIIRDLVETSVNMVHDQKMSEVQEKAETLANEKIIDYLVSQVSEETPAVRPAGRQETGLKKAEDGSAAERSGTGRRVGQAERGLRRQRKKVAEMLLNHMLDEETIEIDVEAEPEGFGSMVEFMAGMSSDEMTESFHDFVENVNSMSKKRSRRVSVKEAQRILTEEEAHKLIDFDAIVDDAVQRTEQQAVVFVDEIDKIVGSNIDIGADVSGEGVQRDLLPIIEGSTVMTRYGPVKTDFILFIAAGAFHASKPADLIPELQGRLPLRVELQALSEKDMRTILTQPQNALTKQYQALLATEEVGLEFTEDGLNEIAQVACVMNTRSEDIGARRLHTIMEKVLEDLSFNASEHGGETVSVDKEYVTGRLGNLLMDEDLSKFIL
jgi:ATP-dependent HslUV protease ATP-binding subunit HslU